MFQLEGYTDMYNMDSATLSKKTEIISRRKLPGEVLTTGKRTYEFIFVPNCGFLNSNMPLLSNCELRLSFDRATAEVALVQNTGTVTTDLTSKVIAIKDCYAVTEYVSSEKLRDHFSRIESRPIKYQFDECDVTLKSIPERMTNLRLDNIRGGNSPTCIFIGLIKTTALTGSFAESSVGFHRNKVESINITLNGRTVNGYPIQVSESPVNVMYNFFDVTNRFMNPLAGECPSYSTFKCNWLYAHKFEAESTSQGWLGVHLTLTEAFTEPYTLVIWSSYNSAITIDKFHQVEKVFL